MASTMYAMPSKLKSGRSENTTFSQRYSMLEWLEMQPGTNFQLITGQSTKSMPFVVAGMPTSKKTGFQMMAEFVNQRTSSNWTSNDASTRFKSWEKSLKVHQEAIKTLAGKSLCLEKKISKRILDCCLHLLLCPTRH